MIILTKEEILLLHAKLIRKTGGLSSVRDMNLLESAIGNYMQTFDGTELYPTIIEKAAIIVLSLCKNHPFIDGNKRIAVLTMLVMLKLNQVEISCFYVIKNSVFSELFIKFSNICALFSNKCLK